MQQGHTGWRSGMDAAWTRSFDMHQSILIKMKDTLNIFLTSLSGSYPY
jgi:hypothetical protein